MSSVKAAYTCPPPTTPPFAPGANPGSNSQETAVALLPDLYVPSTEPAMMMILPSPTKIKLVTMAEVGFPSFLSLSFEEL